MIVQLGRHYTTAAGWTGIMAGFNPHNSHQESMKMTLTHSHNYQHVLGKLQEILTPATGIIMYENTIDTGKIIIMSK